MCSGTGTDAGWLGSGACLPPAGRAAAAFKKSKPDSPISLARRSGPPTARSKGGAPASSAQIKSIDYSDRIHTATGHNVSSITEGLIGPVYWRLVLKPPMLLCQAFTAHQNVRDQLPPHSRPPPPGHQPLRTRPHLPRLALHLPPPNSQSHSSEQGGDRMDQGACDQARGRLQFPP